MAQTNQFGIRHLILLTAIVGYVVAGTNSDNPLAQTMLIATTIATFIVLGLAFFLFMIGVKLDGDIPRYLRRRRKDAGNEEEP